MEKSPGLKRAERAAGAGLGLFGAAVGYGLAGHLEHLEDHMAKPTVPSENVHTIENLPDELSQLAPKRQEYLHEQKRAEFFGDQFNPSPELEAANGKFLVTLEKEKASEWDYVPRMHVGKNYDAQVETGLEREGFSGEEAEKLREFFLALVVAESYDEQTNSLSTQESSKGAFSHFQLMPKTAQAVGKESGLEKPLDIALHYFTDLYCQYGESPWVAVAGYSSGESKTFHKKIVPAWKSMGEKPVPAFFLDEMKKSGVPLETISEVLKVAYMLGYVEPTDLQLKDNPALIRKYSKAREKYLWTDR